MIRLLSILTVTALLLPASAGAQEQPTVDLSVRHGAIRHNGNGFHGGIHENVQLDRVVAVKPALIRRYGAQTFEVARQAGSEVVCLLPNYEEGYTWQTDWSRWNRVIERRVSEIKAGKRDYGISYHYDIWNEPDNWRIENYNEFWCKTAARIRELDSSARIAGPSYSHAGQLHEFLSYCKDYSQQHNVNACPDILNWHEFSDPMKIIDTVNDARRWLADNGLDRQVTEFTVNEFMMSPMPDIIPRMFTATEIADVNYAACGYGSRGRDQLNGLVKTDGKTPNGAWHSYKFYADSTGEVVDVEHSEKVDVFAAFDKDEEQGQLRILLGTDKNRTADVNLLVKNMSSTGLFGSSGTVRVSTERYKIWGGVDKQYEVEVDYSGDVLELPLSELVAGVDLLPGSDKHGLGIVISYVPEPTAITVFGCSAILCLRRRR